MNREPVFGKKYRILWRKGKQRSIGEVRNYAEDGKGYRRFFILFDEALMQKISMRFLVSSWGSQGPEITVSRAFMDLPRAFREAAIWHEIGHVHYEHLFDPTFQNQDELREARLEAIKSGRVVSSEAEADRFAVENVGKDAITGFLKYLMLTRPTGDNLGWNDAGKKELELRIAAIEAL
jgi:hypothetical protein